MTKEEKPYNHFHECRKSVWQTIPISDFKKQQNSKQTSNRRALPQPNRVSMKNL